MAFSTARFLFGIAKPKWATSARAVRSKLHGEKLLCVLIATALSGCASLGGAQQPITSDDIGKSVCPSDPQIAAFEQLGLTDRGANRDDVISGCIDAIDGKYRAFKMHLQKESTSVNLTVDLLSLGLAGAASLTTGSTAKDLASGAATVIGAGTAINKDVFYQQTLPAIESAMDTNRDKIHIRIVNSQASDPSAKTYTLASARSDIAAYEDAGNIYVAISQLTSTASQQSQATKDDLQQAKIAYTSQILDDSVYSREKKLVDDIRAYENTKNGDVLKNIAGALKVPQAADLAAERKSIVAEIDKRVSEASVSDPKKEMDNLSALLRPFTGKDY